MRTHTQDHGNKLYEPLLVGGILVVLAYTAMYLLAASPVLIRALGPMFAS
nr:hypothetical protein [Gammaproteobacteria bacterium]